MQKAQEEVQHLFRSQGDVNEDGLHELKYLDSVIEESLRMHPPFPLLLPREGTVRLQIDYYDIPEKARTTINASTIGRDPRHRKEHGEILP
ncbi:unnamed protein product [Linum trigynum]|uniref:Cytochrome P450 n=1 Tax=Linum trigynum TaxID=586398 RepID=A0AAV2CMX4_9ROSI